MHVGRVAVRANVLNEVRGVGGSGVVDSDGIGPAADAPALLEEAVRSCWLWRSSVVVVVVVDVVVVRDSSVEGVHAGPTGADKDFVAVFGSDHDTARDERFGVGAAASGLPSNTEEE